MLTVSFTGTEQPQEYCPLYRATGMVKKPANQEQAVRKLLCIFKTSFTEKKYCAEYTFINYSKQHRGRLLEIFLIFSKTNRVPGYRETLVYRPPWGGDCYQNTAVKPARFHHLLSTPGKSHQYEF